MDATECFEDHETCVFNEFIHPNDDEEIVNDNRLAFVQFQTCTFKIEVHQQMFQEFGDWITVGVRFLLNDSDQVFESITTAWIDDHSGSQITQNMRAHRLDGIQVQWFVQEHFNDQITSLWVVHEDEHAPVDQPGALLQSFNVAKIGGNQIYVRLVDWTLDFDCLSNIHLKLLLSM